MKILYVSQYFPPETNAPAARVYELARHWARMGHEVTVLTGFPNHPTGVIPPDYRAKWRRLVCREHVDGINVIRVWLAPFANRGVQRRILNFISFWLSSSLVGTFLARPDTVIATSPQLLVGLTGWWLGKVKRAPFFFEVRDLWPEELTAVGASGRRSVVYRSSEAVARFLYRRSDHIVVVTPAFKDRLIAHWGIDPKKISVVENGVETSLFSPGGDGVVRKELGLEGKFVVSYIGTIGMAHGLDTVLEVAEKVRADNPGIAFVLVGEGAERENLRSMAARKGLTNVLFVDQRPRELVPGYIRASDACLVLLKKKDYFTTVIPTKLLEFMACGRPVILGVEGQAREIVEHAGAGLCVEPENVGALATAILRLDSDAALRRVHGENGRRWILEHFSRVKTAAAYLEVLQGIKGSRVRVSEPLLKSCDSAENPRRL